MSNAPEKWESGLPEVHVYWTCQCRKACVCSKTTHPTLHVEFIDSRCGALRLTITHAIKVAELRARHEELEVTFDFVCGLVRATNTPDVNRIHSVLLTKRDALRAQLAALEKESA